ncbi:uncharacterized protein LOC142097438 [Mixophyes fleayi]|uniref:uncharacterized protein LOC142097438 n=1 Tax=Mixophyes fleayi TaxID=3061075 RepID=UPI003F4D80B8
MRSGGEGPSEENESFEATVPEESVIVISDDEGDVSLGLGNSVLLIEDAGDGSLVEEKKVLEVLDEEIAITFSKKAHVMPHARYDCSTHPFVRTEQETQIPIEVNASFCAECYCYLCDKPASECSYWTVFSGCHCNAHNKSKYWKEQRDGALAGVLTIFNLDLTEIDSELREGGNLLESFLSELPPVYRQYLEGTVMTRDSIGQCSCACHKAKRRYKCNICALHHAETRVHTYKQVHTLVIDYLSKADKESPKTTAVMLLGAAKELVSHRPLPCPFLFKDPTANFKEASLHLMTRIVTTLQNLLVVANYPPNLHEKFVWFFQSIPLPPHCYSLINCLNVLRWDNCFLTSVLAGQNLSGVRTNKGKKEFLWEPMTVVQARVQRLGNEHSYRQLVRYLNAVRSTNMAGLNFLKQKLCFYMCKYGDFTSAAHSLLQIKGMQGSISSLLTPAQFELYMTMLRTKSCPPGEEPAGQELCTVHEGIPVKKGVLVRIALRILFCNNKLLYEPKCWSALVRIWCTSEHLSKEGKLVPFCIYEPDKILQRMVMEMSCSILDELLRQTNVHLPDPFHKPSSWIAAELILIVQAVVRFMMTSLSPLKGMLELVLSFGCNHWALSLLIEGVCFMQKLLFNFINNLNKELCEEEHNVIDVFRTRGPVYVSQLVSLFLLHINEGLRSVGFHIIDILLRNSSKIPWTPVLGNNLKNSVLSNGSSYLGSAVERQKLVANIESLTAQS